MVSIVPATCMKKKSAMSLSSELPSDVIFNILLLLPVKTVCRPRCVSKTWSSLISSPSFLNSHRQLFEQNALLFVAFWRGPEKGYRILNKQGKILDHQALETTRPSQVAFSCLDLVCFYDNKRVYIRNPSTREQITLPESPFDRFVRICSSAWNEPICCSSRLAFAYIASKSEYKVFKIYQKLGGWLAGETVCEVFTLGTECWRAVKGPPLKFDYKFHMPVFDEAVFLVPEVEQVAFGTGVARFDLKREEWSIVRLPGHKYFASTTRNCGCRLRQLGGRRQLCMVCYGGEGNIDLWFLKDYNNVCTYNEWVKEYSIKIIDFEYPLAIEEDGRVLFRKLDGTLFVGYTFLALWSQRWKV